MARSRRAHALLTTSLVAIASACAPAKTRIVERAPAMAASTSAPAASATSPVATPPTALELAPIDEGGSWPPPAITPVVEPTEPGEGEWVAYAPPWMHAIAGAPAAFQRTFVRPDRTRPGSRVLLVAMDARQLEFDVEAGVEDPKFVVGGKVKKEGRLPRTHDVASRVVAAWNGGFRTEHGFYGVMLKKHVFIPPVPHAAVAVVMDDGRFGFGTWGPTKDVDPDVLSFRQNLDPLVADGVLNPRGRPRWGGILQQPGQTGDRTKRSAMCLTHARHVVYGWGNDVGPAALAKAMQLAGCQYAIHLDMNPIHTGFLFMSYEDETYAKGKTEILALPMGGIQKRFVESNPKDFFYAMIRDVARPTSMRTGPISRLAWAPDEGTQPPPAWSPAVFRARSGDVDLLLFERDRVGFALRLGEDERASVDATTRAATSTLDGEPARRVIATLGLGVAPNGTQLGLAIEGVTAIASDPAKPSLVVDARGDVRIVDPGAALDAEALVQGRSLVREGAPTPDLGADVGERVGVGLTREGHLVVARGRTTESALAAALVEAGVVSAIAGRGAGSVDVARAGRDAKLWSRHPGTTLFVIARAMSPRAFRWDRDADGAPRWPEWGTPIP